MCLSKMAQSQPTQADNGGLAPSKDVKFMAVVPVTAVMQPLILSRTLMQVGYEPLEPVLGKSFFLRKPCYYYPSIFQYLNHIKKTEGVAALFTGLTPKLCNVILGQITENNVNQFLRDKFPLSGESAETPIDRKGFKATLYEIGICCTAKTAGVIVTQPFQVVMVRMICSVINKDEAYSGLRSTVKEIYDGEGVAGFYSGFMPRWLAEMAVISLGGTVMYGLYRLMSALDVEEESVRRSTNYNAIVQFALSTMVYKYQLTSTITSASCTGLHIGLPSYPGWRSVLNDLYHTNQLGRGSSYFYRKAIL